MIRVLDDLPGGVLGFEASGTLTAGDYTDVLAPALATASAGGGKIRVLLDVTGEFDGMEGGAVWQDLRMGISERNAWERIALVTDHAWMRDGLAMFAWAVPGEVRAFSADGRATALDWLQQP